MTCASSVSRPDSLPAAQFGKLTLISMVSFTPFTSTPSYTGTESDGDFSWSGHDVWLPKDIGRLSFACFRPTRRGPFMSDSGLGDFAKALSRLMASRTPRPGLAGQHWDGHGLTRGRSHPHPDYVGVGALS